MIKDKVSPSHANAPRTHAPFTLLGARPRHFLKLCEFSYSSGSRTSNHTVWPHLHCSRLVYQPILTNGEQLDDIGLRNLRSITVWDATENTELLGVHVSIYKTPSRRRRRKGDKSEIGHRDKLGYSPFKLLLEARKESLQ